ncbi:MAG: zinc dependent phospholipase C family protein [Thermodesulfobacteriota bacterium]
MFYIVIISVVVVALLAPGEAHAWGPATHLELGRDVLNNLGILAPAVRGIIERFPYDYLYGTISADIVVGKNLAREIEHCHNWRFGFNLMKRADDNAKRAFAHGYMSHLAADTVSHNIFIPERMVSSFATRIHRHVYWELRFDALVDKSIWRIPREIARAVHRENDRFLDSVLRDTPLSFRTNKTIFSSLLMLNRVKRWHHMIDVLSSRSKWKLNKGERLIYYRLSLDAVTGLLTKGKNATCLKRDPTGKASLTSAKHIRRRLKAMKRSGKEWEPAMERALQMFLSG